MEWFLMNDCTVVNRGQFESGKPNYDMMREFIQYVSGNIPLPLYSSSATDESAESMEPDDTSNPTEPTEPTEPDDTSNPTEPDDTSNPTEPTEPAEPTNTKRQLADEIRCTIVRKNGDRCMRQRNDNGCPDFCGTHSAMLSKSNLTKEEFIEKCGKTKVVKKRTTNRTTKTATNHSVQKPSTQMFLEDTTATTVEISQTTNDCANTPKPANRKKSGIAQNNQSVTPARSTIFHNGIPYVVDYSGKVFNHRDIIEGKEDPRVIGNYLNMPTGEEEIILFDDTTVGGRVSPVTSV
jgi:hypothetical protein